ncbi:MAG: MptD family putative ECF transporter S component [Candidatus Atribacteria bacterium]|jgi:energy-coupling factor transport system substrate-specific component|nr:MptD family putative ECF transporter S component [Candidatus Atribacteria bacterium]
MDNNKLNTQDLITTEIFTAIYIVIFFICGMLGYIPILLVFLPLICPIVTGIPFMLFLTKVKKFGMVTIMGLIIGLVMFLTGHTWMPVATGLIFGLLADLVFKAGKYQSSKNSILGYGVFSMFIIGAMMPMWVMRDSYFEYMSSSMGTEYVATVMSLTPEWMFFVLMIVAFIAGIIGALLGKSVLKKHFKRAGIA